MKKSDLRQIIKEELKNLLKETKFDLKDIKVGDKIQVDSSSGMASGGESKVTKVTKDYIFADEEVFDRKTGFDIEHPIYYIAYKITRRK